MAAPFLDLAVEGSAIFSDGIGIFAPFNRRFSTISGAFSSLLATHCVTIWKNFSYLI